jgi:hypothetical protein
MREDIVIREGFPLGKEKGKAIRLLLKESEIFDERFGIPEMGDND